MAVANLRKAVTPLLVVFIVVNTACFVLKDWLIKKEIDPYVVMGANVIVFILAIVSLLMHHAAIKSANPYAFVRSVMLATVLKLLVIASAVLIYLYNAGANRNKAAVLIGMVLYFAYTAIEVKGAFKMNKKNNGSI